MRQHPDIIFMRTDKDNTTVAMNRDDDVNKITAFLTTLTPIKSLNAISSKKNIESNLLESFKRCLNKRCIDMRKFYSFRESSKICQKHVVPRKFTKIIFPLELYFIH